MDTKSGLALEDAGGSREDVQLLKERLANLRTDVESMVTLAEGCLASSDGNKDTVDNIEPDFEVVSEEMPDPPLSLLDERICVQLNN